MNIVSSLTVLFCVEKIALFQYSLQYSQYSCPCCRQYIITLFRINTHFIYFYSYLYLVAITNHEGDSYPVFWVSHIRCYCRDYCCTIYFIIATMNIVSSLTVIFYTKHYSTYTLFTAFVSKTVFYITNSS